MQLNKAKRVDMKTNSQSVIRGTFVITNSKLIKRGEAIGDFIEVFMLFQHAQEFQKLRKHIPRETPARNTVKSSV